MAIVTKQIFTTSDNKTFTDHAEAVAHEAYLEKAEVIEAYIASTGMKPPQAGTFRRHIGSFQQFQNSYVPGSYKPAEKTAEAPAEGAAE